MRLQDDVGHPQRPWRPADTRGVSLGAARV